MIYAQVALDVRTSKTEGVACVFQEHDSLGHEEWAKTATGDLFIVYVQPKTVPSKKEATCSNPVSSRKAAG